MLKYIRSMPNGLAAALQADKTKKSFWQKVNNKTRSPPLPTSVGGANGGSEIVKNVERLLREY